ncbi:MAG: hypothetical protein ABUK01_03565 [Leptospirales bacterium]
MLEAFDGFIAAVSSELKIPFQKEDDGEYTANIDFEGGRHQKVWVTLDRDEAGDPIINYYSHICKIAQDNLEIFKEALSLNTSLTYGATALMGDDNLIMHQATFLKDMDPQRFIKSLFYVAAKADELEEQFIGQDIS